MASPTVSPVLARQLVSALAQGGPQAATGAAGSDGNDQAGQQLSSQMSELNNADPQMGLRAVQQMKAMGVALYPRFAFSVPEAARHMAQAQKSLDAAIKALEQAAATQNAVRPAIANRASLPSPPVGTPTPTGGALPVGGAESL